MSGGLVEGTSLHGGRYTLKAIIGEGGFGITYKATDRKLSRVVAIKELFPKGSIRQEEAVVPVQQFSGERWDKMVEAFVREAQILAGLQDKGIVPVHDYFDANNTAYMVMAFIDGMTLAQYMKRHGGHLDEREAIHYVKQVGMALKVLHEHRILHRDVTPNNIMWTRDYQAVLIDFGSAREFIPNKSVHHTTAITNGFAPPEQFLPNGVKAPASDIYSLAVTCYCLVTGKMPRLPELVGVSSTVRLALAHALLTDVRARPQSTVEFIAELKGERRVDTSHFPPSWLGSPPPIAGPSRPAAQSRPVSNSHPRSDSQTRRSLGAPDASHPLARSSQPLNERRATGRSNLALWLALAALVALLIGGVIIFLLAISSPSAIPTPITHSTPAPTVTPTDIGAVISTLAQG